MRPESAEQRAFVAWFRLQYPGVLIFSIPNGSVLAGDAAQRARQMNALKAEGLTPGVPDLFIPRWDTFLEMKAAGGRLSASQEAMREQLIRAGYVWLLARGCDDAIRQIKQFRSAA